ncbi:MAG: 3-deoxy-D-manno-octulosonic acid transferase [Desulfomonilia bacterium]
MAELILILYRLLSSIVVWPLALVLKNHPNFISTIPARLSLSLPEACHGRHVVWVHAASVGEVRAASALVKSIKEHCPECFTFLTSMTATGRHVAGNAALADMVYPFPFDSYRSMKRLLLRLQPSVILVIETEIWPNMLCAAGDLEIPFVFVNARMSLKSFQKYRMLSPFLRKLLNRVHVMAMSGDDAKRFSRLGAGDVQVLGNLKLDAIGTADPCEVAGLRAELGIGTRPVFIAGSIREGEEESVIEAVVHARSQIRDLFTIVAPRHPDRVDRVRSLAERSGIRTTLRSSLEQNSDLLVVDTMGELFRLYGISDVAFVGGSLVDLGGQNILEPVAWGVPTLHGPHMDNFTWALEVVRGHTVGVASPRELADAVVTILRNREGYTEMTNRARAALLEAHGVTDRYVHALEPFLRSTP